MLKESRYLTKRKERTFSKYSVNLLGHINLKDASETEVTNLLIAASKELESRKLLATYKKYVVSEREAVSNREVTS